MPNEPDNTADEQLKAWAAARRSEASGPFELHPATRKLLQDEVARSFPAAKPEAGPGPGWLALLRPRFTFALSMVAAMLVIGVAIWPSLYRNRTSDRQLFADRGEELLEQRKMALLRTEAQVPNDPAVASRTGNEALPPPAAVPALAVNAPTPSTDTALPYSRAANFGEAAQTLDARSDLAKNSRESLQRRDSVALPKPVAAEKSKEIALAKDEVKLSESAALGTSARREEKVEQFGLKPAADAGLGGAQTTATARKTDERDLALNVKDASVAGGKRAAAPLPAAGTLDDKGAVLSYQKSQAVAQLEPPAAPAAEQERLQSSNVLGFSNLATGPVTQQFAQVARYRRNFNSPPTPKVLTSFQLEQHGSQLRIVDADGSVYEGEFSPAMGNTSTKSFLADKNEVEFKKSAATQSPTAAGQVLPVDAATDGNQSTGFRVEGMNRTLNQQVVFAGNLWTSTNPAPSSAAQDTPPRGAVLLQQSAASRNVAQQIVPRVQGQVTVGNDRIEINAVSAGP